MAFLSANSYMGLVVEATRGTLPTGGTPVYIPVTSPQTTPMQTFLRDEAFRGSPTTVYDQVQGVRHDEYEGKFYLYADTFGNFAKAVLGGTDTLTTTATVSGTSTTITTSTLVMSGATWVVNAYAGMVVVTGSSSAAIASNTSTTLTLTTAGWSGGTPSTGAFTIGAANHNIKLLNNSTTGSQPQSYSIFDFDGANQFVMTGAQADSLAITFGAEAAADATVKFMANPYTSYTSAPAPFTSLSLSTEHLIPAWDTVITVSGINSGAALTYIQTGELKLERKTAPIFTMGTQAPLVNFAGPIEVSGKFTAVVNTNADAWSTGSTAEALTRSPQVVTITLTDPNDSTSATPHSIAFTMNSVQFHTLKRTRGKEYTEVEVDFTANANATDATTGYSPVQATIVNATATPY